MKAALAKLIGGLSPMQCAAVVAVFCLTSIGAILLALALRRWNARRAKNQESQISCNQVR